MEKWHVIVHIIFTLQITCKGVFPKTWLFRIRLTERQSPSLCLEKVHRIPASQVLWSPADINILRSYIMHTAPCVHKILVTHQQGKGCRNTSLSQNLLVKMNTGIFRTELINESFSWLVHIRANVLFPMKNSFVKEKEETSWVVF